MTRSKRLEPVKRLANESADQAAKVFAQQRAEVADQQQRLAQLEAYRQEYRDKLRAAGAQGIDAFRLRDYNAFMDRIDAAILRQKDAVGRSEREAERSRTQWLHLLSRARAIDTVVERAQADERRAASKREQRMLDELAQLRRTQPLGSERS